VIVIYSPEGAGKTSFATNFKDATFAMSESETGLLHLMAKGLVEPCNYFPEFKAWTDVVEATDEMICSADRPRSFVVDTIGGVQNLLIDHVCETKYNGEMSKRGFMNFSEGFDVMAPIWRAWLAKLEQLRNKGTTIVLLSHCQTITHKNPEGTDFHRYVAELHPKMWSPARKFADLIVFLNFNESVAGGDIEAGTVGTGQGGSTRVYNFERTAAFDAKNRHALPAKMPGTGDHAKDFASFCELVKAGEAKKKPATKSKATKAEDKPAEDKPAEDKPAEEATTTTAAD